MRISDWSSDVCSSDLERPASWRKGNEDCFPDPEARRHAGHHCADRDRWRVPRASHAAFRKVALCGVFEIHRRCDSPSGIDLLRRRIGANEMTRSEEHTSELQSLMRISYAVFCLKKKNINR